MPDFAYVARDMSGRRVTGTVSAGTERDVANQLAARSLFPVEVKTAAGAGGVTLYRSKRVKGQTMAQFYAQLASLLRSGVPMLRSLNVLAAQSSNTTLREVIQEVRGRIEDGEPMGQAMARYPRVFSPMAINMVRAGTEGGFLEDALERVAQFTDLQEDLKGRTASALAYPIFLTTVGTIVVTCLVVFFVPKFGELFEGLRRKGEMPMMTELLLGLSAFLQTWGLLLLGGVVAAAIAVRTHLQTEIGQVRADRLRIKIPVIGGILLNLAVARFCRVLGTLLANGVPILRSLEISRAAAGNRVLAEAVTDAAENVRSGESLSVPLAASGHFPVTVTEMISVAEESNTLDRVLVEIADGLEKRTFRRLDLFVRLLEPVLLLILAGVVLCVVIALLMPVIKASSTL